MISEKKMDSETEKLKEQFTLGGRVRRARSCTIKKEPEKGDPKEKEVKGKG